jgi:hypothetical protein
MSKKVGEFGQYGAAEEESFSKYFRERIVLSAVLDESQKNEETQKPDMFTTEGG